MNKNWRSRCIAIRRDRVEWHVAEPRGVNIPRGVVRLSPETVVERIPDYRANRVTIPVSDGTTDLYLCGMSEAEMDRWEAKLREVIAAAGQNAPMEVQQGTPTVVDGKLLDAAPAGSK